MILVGNQRGGAGDLARHLLKEENEHVELFEVRGFAAHTLSGALNEAYALSRAGRCRQFLFSLSVNPPSTARVSTESFIKAIERAESALDLSGQPRAIVFHEKKGRRHAHVVWSRIDPVTLKAVPLPFTKRKLVALTRDLFVEHGWQLPNGLISPERRDPRNFTLAEWQQARRNGKDPRAIKVDLQDAWASSDGLAALVNALEVRGYKLAKGDRRAFVAVDHTLEPYALHKWLGLRVRDVRNRLEDGAALPTFAEAKSEMADGMAIAARRIEDEIQSRERKAQEAFMSRRQALVERQQRQRQVLVSRQTQRERMEHVHRASRFRVGLSGVWDRLRGEHRRIRRINQIEAFEAGRRDQRERDALAFRHIEERQQLDIFAHRVSRRFESISNIVERERQVYDHAARTAFDSTRWDLDR